MCAHPRDLHEARTTKGVSHQEARRGGAKVVQRNTSYRRGRGRGGNEGGGEGGRGRMETVREGRSTSGAERKAKQREREARWNSQHIARAAARSRYDVRRMPYALRRTPRTVVGAGEDRETDRSSNKEDNARAARRQGPSAWWWRAGPRPAQGTATAGQAIGTRVRESDSPSALRRIDQMDRGPTICGQMWSSSMVNLAKNGVLLCAGLPAALATAADEHADETHGRRRAPTRRSGRARRHTSYVVRRNTS